MADQGAPPNIYSSMASMPGPAPAPKKNDKTEELMKGCHGVFKALSKMEAMESGLTKDFAAAKTAIKNAVANVLKGNPDTLDDDGSSAPPPNTESNMPAPAPATTTPPPGVPLPTA